METRENYSAVIYNYYNIVIRVEERPTRERAIMAGQFYTRLKNCSGAWYQVVEGEDVDLYKALINA